ncbi:ribonuclease H-like domain-containing protein [Phnomibacter ginsenosidimutans]|jgi:hypothetical protein|nr:ribonuclease H-like domain-containing protein [Phnomibacter ginsenosidimutans]
MQIHYLTAMQIPQPEQCIFIDIETVSQQPDFKQLPAEWQSLFEEKTSWLQTENSTPESLYQEKAAIMAEFGKIICISVGYLRKDAAGKFELRLKSFYGDDEAVVLTMFVQSVTQLMQARKMRMWFAGHNIREFDIPYICRRLLVQGQSLPQWLDFQALKPWDVPLLDTLQLWKFGDYKHFTSLKLLAACLGIASPKQDLDGSMVGNAYWQEKALDKIVSYCQRDVLTVAQLLLRFSQLPLLNDEQVVVQ